MNTLLQRFAILIVCFCLTLGFSVAVAQTPPPVPGSQTVVALFVPAVQQLQTQPVPIVLPTELPFTVYPYVRSSDSTGYSISLDHTPGCHGAGYCNDGELIGAAITQSTPSISEQYAFLNQPNFQPTARSPESMSAVDLARGIQGYFIPYVCGANCDNSKIVWDQGGYRYTVGIHTGTKVAVLALANSAIDNEK